MEHPLALRTPWYVLEREDLPVTDPAARRPAIQKYDRPEFVRELIADPRRSLGFSPDEDVWSFPVPVGAFPRPGRGRARFATHRFVRTSMPKLFQPSHDRFYAVTVELFCDEPGLPRPGDTIGTALRFVVRRERFVVHGDARAARTLARDLAVELDAEQEHPEPVTSVPGTDDVDDVLWVARAQGRPLPADRLADIQPVRVVEAWVVGEDGTGRWTPVAGDEPPTLLPGEQEYPMWPLPPREQDCARARTRSLWFGIVPTFSGDVDADTSRAKLDDRSIYRIRCFARRQPAPGLEHCPPRLWWSDPSTAYRLASFYDPEGTKNRRVSITLPDLRSLAARAGQQQGPGGVEIVRPPGSQLKFDSDNGTPVNASTTDFGDTTSRCTFAIELLMIVAMFLFSLFLPVVVLLFRLWWLLLLRFCFPRPALTLEVLDAFFAGGGTIAALPQTAADPPDPDDPPLPDRDMLDELLEVRGGTTQLAIFDTGLRNSDELGAALVADLDPQSASTTPDRTPEPVPDDPLCGGPSPPGPGRG